MDDFIEKAAELADTEEEAYRLGYLAKLASMGISPGELEPILDRGMSKSALGAVGLGLAAHGGLKMLQNTVPLALAVGAVPAVFGTLSGRAAKDEASPSAEDVAMMEDEVLAEEYRRETNRLRQAAALRDGVTGRKGRRMGI